MMTAVLPSLVAPLSWADPIPNPSPAESIKRPAQLGMKTPDRAFRCDRMIKWKKETLPCDSPLLWDGENLRPIMANTPDAIFELDQYQRGRRALRGAAYVGTVGVVFALANSLIAGLITPKGHDLRKSDTESTLRYGGIGLTAGAVIFGYTMLRSNEQHLDSAIVKYNSAQPGTPIEVLFQKDF